ncbi:hypothetical protein V8F06_008928 [Rhypophila decipiens]
MGNSMCCPRSSSSGRSGGTGFSSGSGSSSDSSHYTVPRNRDNYDDGGYHRYSRRAAQELLLTAPAPTVSADRYGRRPHAHYDFENAYRSERAGLSPIPGAPNRMVNGVSRSPPRLFGYAGHPGFNYAAQNRRGEPLSNQARQAVGPQAGPIRLVADRDRNLVGVSYHPQGSFSTFQRATHHPRRSRRS